MARVARVERLGADSDSQGRYNHGLHARGAIGLRQGVLQHGVRRQRGGEHHLVREAIARPVGVGIVDALGVEHAIAVHVVLVGEPLRPGEPRRVRQLAHQHARPEVRLAIAVGVIGHAITVVVHVAHHHARRPLVHRALVQLQGAQLQQLGGTRRRIEARVAHHLEGGAIHRHGGRVAEAHAHAGDGLEGAIRARGHLHHARHAGDGVHRGAAHVPGVGLPVTPYQGMKSGVWQGCALVAHVSASMKPRST